MIFLVKRGSFKNAEKRVKSIITASNSFLLNENVNRYGTGLSSYYRGSYQIKVEANKYDSVISQLKDIGEVTSFNENARDVTGRHTNLQIELEAEQERLLRYKEMYAQATDVSDKIAKVSPGQSINYFRKIFGAEITNRKVSDENRELIFRYKTSYIQIIVDNDENVVFFSVTDCKNPVEILNSAFKSAYSGNKQIFPDKVILNKTTFSNFFRFNDESREYFISGATANSYYYEYEYNGNPAHYQTFFIGINDICGLSNFSLLSSFKDYNSKEDIEEFRRKVFITTYGESAPFAGDKILNLLKENKIYLGPDRVLFRVFTK